MLCTEMGRLSSFVRFSVTLFASLGMDVSALLEISDKATELFDMLPPQAKVVVGHVTISDLNASLETYANAVKGWLSTPSLRSMAPLIPVHNRIDAAMKRVTSDRTNDLSALGLPSTGVFASSTTTPYSSLAPHPGLAYNPPPAWPPSVPSVIASSSSFSSTLHSPSVATFSPPPPPSSGEKRNANVANASGGGSGPSGGGISSSELSGQAKAQKSQKGPQYQHCSLGRVAHWQPHFINVELLSKAFKAEYPSVPLNDDCMWVLLSNLTHPNDFNKCSPRGATATTLAALKDWFDNKKWKHFEIERPADFQ